MTVRELKALLETYPEDLKVMAGFQVSIDTMEIAEVTPIDIGVVSPDWDGIYGSGISEQVVCINTDCPHIAMPHCKTVPTQAGYEIKLRDPEPLR